MMADTALEGVPLRVPDADWAQFRALHGKAVAAEIRAFIAWQLHRPGAPEPSRPAAPRATAAALVPAEALEELAAWWLRSPAAELPRRPGGETRPKTVRLPAADWAEFVELHGGKASEAVKMFIAWQLHRPGAWLPDRLLRP